MTRSQGAAAAARRALAVLLAIVPCTLPSGCALFTDLSSDPYRPAEAGPGEGGSCTADAGCTYSEIVCSGPCPGGQVCCLSASATGVPSVGCTDQTACGGQGTLSYQLCTGAADCPGASCIRQMCSFAGTTIVESACSMIQTCTPL